MQLLTSQPKRHRRRRRKPQAASFCWSKRSLSSSSSSRLECSLATGFLAFGGLWIVVVLYFIGTIGTKMIVRRRGVGPGQLVKQKYGNEKNPAPSDKEESSPLLIFACHRAHYLQETLEDVLRYLPREEEKCGVGCPIIVSQDGTDKDVAQVVRDFQQRMRDQGYPFPLLHWQHTPKDKGEQLRATHLNGYQKLAVHYGWALKRVFNDDVDAGRDEFLRHHIPQRVIILEEDIHIAPDFFDYFAATASLLDRDPTLLAVSAFNDNGYQGKVQAANRILRSDFFPGLGWMLTRKLWTNELQHGWPGGYWDDWLREPAQRRDRHILRPEISRTFHFGTEGGTSGNQFGNNLASIELYKSTATPVDWASEPLDNLFPETYNPQYLQLVRSATLAQNLDDALLKISSHNNSPVRLEYRSWPQFQHLAEALGLMTDEKAGIPRTAYKGVVETRPHGEQLLFLTPPMEQLEKDLAE